MPEDKFREFAAKMKAAGVPDIAIENFNNHYRQLLAGGRAYIPESAIRPLTALPDIEQLSAQHEDIGKRQLAHTVLLKLNGGLGTSMGMEQAKSLIRLKQGYRFLDIIARHALHAQLRLVLMNSRHTRMDSIHALEKYPELHDPEIPLDFIQHSVPKINQADLGPASFPGNRELEWCPPGHGDIYIALLTSGMLARLLAAGYRYAFISNADNLGATIHPGLLGYLVEQGLSFLMEVTDRTDMDKKGGHLAYEKGRGLILREAAQCPEEDRNAFQDIARHRYFNTNNLWINLQRLGDMLKAKGNIPSLPLIVNRKRLDPKDPESAPVFQLESAMGAAISVLPNTRAICVPRSRFVPVKTTNELLLVRSDLYELSANKDTLERKTQQASLPPIKLDAGYYQLIDDFEARFRHGIPSLLQCRGLEIKGDVLFGKNTSIKGKVTLRNHSHRQIKIPDDTTIDGDMSWES